MYGQCQSGGGWILRHLIDGTQAELARIPFADNSLHQVPEGSATSRCGRGRGRRAGRAGGDDDGPAVPAEPGDPQTGVFADAASTNALKVVLARQ
jgi:hypothetical protein